MTDQPFGDEEPRELAVILAEITTVAAEWRARRAEWDEAEKRFEAVQLKHAARLRELDDKRTALKREAGRRMQVTTEGGWYNT